MNWPRPLGQEEALAALAHIREAVDRTARYSTFSAFSGFLAGVAALLGSVYCGLCGVGPGLRGGDGRAFLAVWVGVFFFAAVSFLILSALKAKRRGEPVWTPIAKRALLTMAGPVLGGVMGTISLVNRGYFSLLPGFWLILYGCCLYGISFFAPIFLRYLGLIFLLFGFLAWWNDPVFGPFWLGLGFGGLHIIFGLIVMGRYRR